jgi:ERCC4-type nuclease
VDTEEKLEIDSYIVAGKIDYRRERLEEGDYTNDEETFLLERKRSFDLFHSLKSKHIFVQLARMREKHPDTPLFVLFEGSLRSLIDSISEVEYPGMRGLIKTFRYSIAHVYGAMFIESLDMVDTVEHLKDLDRYGKSIKEYKVQFEPIFMSKCVDERIRTLLTVPMLGQKRAEMLLDKYKSISEIINACINSPKEVLNLDGMGKKLIDKIIMLFTGMVPFTKKINMKNDQDREAEEKKRKQSYAIQRSKYQKGK